MDDFNSKNNDLSLEKSTLEGDTYIDKPNCEELLERASFFSEHFRILAILSILNIVFSIIGSGLTKSILPLNLLGKLLGLTCNIIYWVIIFKLSRENRKYLVSAITPLIAIPSAIVFTIISMSINIVYIASEIEIVVLEVIICVFIIILLALSRYYEYRANAEVLIEIDDELSKKWKNLSKWYIWFTFLLICDIWTWFLSILIKDTGVVSLFVFRIFFISIILLVLTIGVVICAIALTILKIVYQFKTSEEFKCYIKENSREIL